MPDGTQVQFPDDMPREQIKSMITSKFPELREGRAMQQQPKMADKEKRPEREVSTMESFITGAGEGAAMGFGDEAMAYLGAGALRTLDAFGVLPEEIGGGRSFEELKQAGLTKIRGDVAEAREANPIAYGTGIATGGVASTLGAAPVKGIAAATKVGAGTGALAGAGFSEEDVFKNPMGFLKDVGRDAATGAAIGGSVSALFKGIGSGLRGATTKKFSKAESSVINALKKEGYSEDAIIQMADEVGKGRVPRTFGELSGSQRLLQKQKRLTQLADEAGDVMKTFNVERSKVIDESIDNFIKQDVSKVVSSTRAGRGAQEASKKLISTFEKRVSEKVKPLYKAAYSTQLDDAVVKELGTDPVIANTVKEMATKPAFVKQLGELPENSLGMFDLVKRGIDDKIEVARRAGEKNAVRILGESRDFLINKLDEASDSYKLARATYAKKRLPIERISKSSIGAIADLDAGKITQAGNKFFNQSKEDISRAATLLRKTDPKVVDDLNASKLMELMEKSGNATQFIGKVSRTPEAINKFRASMTEQQFKGFDRLIKEIRQATSVKFGSDTATNLQIDKMLDDELGTLLATRVAPKGATDIVNEGTTKVLRFISDKFRSKNYAELAELMTGKTAEEFSQKMAKNKVGTAKSLRATADFLANFAEKETRDISAAFIVPSVAGGEE
mgnify:CR=1 FL=1